MNNNFLLVEKENENQRLDKFISKRFSKFSFQKIQKLIRQGNFRVNGKKKNLIINYCF